MNLGEVFSAHRLSLQCPMKLIFAQEGRDLCTEEWDGDHFESMIIYYMHLYIYNFNAETDQWLFKLKQKNTVFHAKNGVVVSSKVVNSVPIGAGRPVPSWPRWLWAEQLQLSPLLGDFHSLYKGQKGAQKLRPQCKMTVSLQGQGKKRMCPKFLQQDRLKINNGH